MFNDSNSEYMLLDTGFTVSVIDSQTAHVKNITVSANVQLTGIGEERRTARIGHSSVGIRLPAGTCTMPELHNAIYSEPGGAVHLDLIRDGKQFRRIIELDPIYFSP